MTNEQTTPAAFKYINLRGRVFGMWRVARIEGRTSISGKELQVEMAMHGVTPAMLAKAVRCGIVKQTGDAYEMPLKVVA